MAGARPLKTLRIGMIGAGFIARFHLESFTGVRNCAITGVYSPRRENRAALATRGTRGARQRARPHRALRRGGPHRLHPAGGPRPVALARPRRTTL